MLFTIFTPAYNRAHTLKRCYDSIVMQSFISLEWIVIDDGSIDNTRDVVKGFIDEGKINIRYFYQDNAGKQAAWNKALQEAKGEFFVGLDSDDALVPNSLIKMNGNLIKIRNSELVLGVRAVAISEKKKCADSDFKVLGNGVASWFDEFASRIFGERIDILKTSEIKKFLYPVGPGIKFIPEVWFYAKTASSGYLFLYETEPVRLFFDEHNHMRLSRSNLRAHAKGHLISRAEMLKVIPISAWARNPIALIKTIVRTLQCIIFCILDSKKK
ncbi:glycosyltransferase [Plesiomonas shigelloides]|nr:glycosyltransferase [Plesiomonas shigelloides]